MANRSFFQFQYSLQQSVVTLYAKTVYATSGTTLSIVGDNGKGFYTITRTGTGVFKFFTGLSAVQPDQYLNIINVQAMSLNASISTIVRIQLTEDDIADASAPSFTLTCINAAGAAVDPADGENILITAVMRNSSK